MTFKIPRCGLAAFALILCMSGRLFGKEDKYTIIGDRFINCTASVSTYHLILSEEEDGSERFKYVWKVTGGVFSNGSPVFRSINKDMSVTVRWVLGGTQALSVQIEAQKQGNMETRMASLSIQVGPPSVLDIVMEGNDCRVRSFRAVLNGDVSSQEMFHWQIENGTDENGNALYEFNKRGIEGSYLMVGPKDIAKPLKISVSLLNDCVASLTLGKSFSISPLDWQSSDGNGTTKICPHNGGTEYSIGRFDSHAQESTAETYKGSIEYLKNASTEYIHINWCGETFTIKLPGDKENSPEAISLLSSARIAPNPVPGNSFQVLFSEAGLDAGTLHLSVYDGKGVLLQSQNAKSNPITVYTHSYPAGMYYLRIAYTHEVATLKFLISPNR